MDAEIGRARALALLGVSCRTLSHDDISTYPYSCRIGSLSVDNLNILSRFLALVLSLSWSLSGKARALAVSTFVRRVFIIPVYFVQTGGDHAGKVARHDDDDFVV